MAGATVALDLSNLCRDRRFLPDGVTADLGLFDRFVEAGSNLPTPIGAITAVADRSLPALLDTDGRRRLRDLERDGVVEFSSLADERLLELAFSHRNAARVLVASMDYFDDFRRIYPEIQGSTDRFLGWQPGPHGTLLVAFRDMGMRSHHRLSRKEEREELKARRLHRHSIIRRATATYFRCDRSDCLLAQLWPDRLPELPRYDDRTDEFVCPSCAHHVIAGGVRPEAAQLIVFLHGVEQFRLLLESGQRMRIGRHDGPNQIGLASRLPSRAADTVSRAHVVFELTEFGVTVEDLGSRNGTVVRSPSAPDAQLDAGTRRILGSRDTLALPDGITVELSGRSVPLDAPSPDDGDPWIDDRATRILSVRR